MITPLHFNPLSREGSDGSNPDAFQQRILFQSTLPRRERLELSSPTLLDTKSISIHAPAKGATDYFFIQLAQSKISIHAPAKGATPRRSARSLPRNFNPRSREGSDRSYVAEVLKTSISIHAPAKGATECYRISTHTDLISIHAPAKGATYSHPLLIYRHTISIHAPAKGATHRSNAGSQRSLYFNPRSREGSDVLVVRKVGDTNHFNPRSREGSDQHQQHRGRNRRHFNPRSREGSDAVVSGAVLHTFLFQSTLPRRERRQRLHF